MKIIRYIYALLIAVILGFFSFACSDDDEQTEEKGAVEKKEDTKQPITTTIKVCVETPDVSGDIDVSTRAGDNANIEYALPENGGRFQNIIIVVTDESDKIYAIHCNKWYTGTDPSSTGVKQYEWIFPDLKIGSGEGSKARVYAVGNVTTGYYETISGYTIADSEKGKKSFSDFEILKKLFGTSATISVSDAYKLKFKPKDGNFIVSGTQINKTRCTGMPVNARIEKDINKGATVFSVHMKRVAARLQITFRNFTGTYIDYDSNEAKDNNIYIDQFEIPGILTTGCQFGAWNSTPSTSKTAFKLSDFIEKYQMVDAEGNAIDKKHVKIKNGESFTVSLYVLETKGGYTYDLKVDRGKSLGNQVSELQNDNVYVMWSDNLDEGTSYANTENRCLGADDSKINLVKMDDPNNIPYGTGEFGNRVFWHYNGGKFQSCKVNLATDVCVKTGKYIEDGDYSKLNSSGTSFSPSYQTFDGFNRYSLHIRSNYYVMISNNVLKYRYILYFKNKKPYYPWVFFAKYIIKTKQPLSTGTSASKTTVDNIERNGSYEIDFSVLPNEVTKQELLVSCVRTQNEISWEETEK